MTESSLTPTPNENPTKDAETKDSESLVTFVYEELRSLADRYLGRERADHTLQPTALVHEAFLRITAQTGQLWESEAHFTAIAARVMRQVLVDHDRARRAAKRGGGCIKISLDDEVHDGEEDQGIDLLDLDQALHRLGNLDDQQGRIVELRFFGGLALDEIASILSVSESTVKRNWRMARAWLYHELSDES